MVIGNGNANALGPGGLAYWARGMCEVYTRSALPVYISRYLISSVTVVLHCGVRSSLSLSLPLQYIFVPPCRLHVGSVCT